MGQGRKKLGQGRSEVGQEKKVGEVWKTDYLANGVDGNEISLCYGWMGNIACKVTAQYSQPYRAESDLKHLWFVILVVIHCKLNGTTLNLRVYCI